MKTVKINIKVGTKSVVNYLKFDVVPEIGDEIILDLDLNAFARINKRVFTLSGEIFIFGYAYLADDKIYDSLLKKHWASNPENLEFS